MSEQPLADAIKVALRYLGGGPPSSAFGIAREDCALAHIDYFGGVEMAASHLCNVLAEVEGRETSEVWKEYGPGDLPCDCKSCVGTEAASAARARRRAAYTNVKEWHGEACPAPAGSVSGGLSGEDT